MTEVANRSAVGSSLSVGMSAHGVAMQTTPATHRCVAIVTSVRLADSCTDKCSSPGSLDCGELGPAQTRTTSRISCLATHCKMMTAATPDKIDDDSLHPKDITRGIPLFGEDHTINSS